MPDALPMDAEVRDILENLADGMFPLAEWLAD
jgi:hypothetical protein